MRREQQIGEAERVPRQPGMTIEQQSDLGDADLRVGDSLDNRVFIDRPIEARRDDAIAGDRRRDPSSSSNPRRNRDAQTDPTRRGAA
jgi:hypothetical protein